MRGSIIRHCAHLTNTTASVRRIWGFTKDFWCSPSHEKCTIDHLSTDQNRCKGDFNLVVANHRSERYLRETASKMQLIPAEVVVFQIVLHPEDPPAATVACAYSTS
jgi:hypothetical protein